MAEGTIDGTARHRQGRHRGGTGPLPLDPQTTPIAGLDSRTVHARPSSARPARPVRLLIALLAAPLAALLLVLVALSSSSASSAASLPPDPSATAPQAAQWRAAQVIPASAMPGWLVMHDYEVPEADLFQGSGAAVDNVRNRTVRGAHERVFDSLDGTYTLSTRVWELTTASRAAFRHTDNVALSGPFPPGARAYVGRDDAQRRGLVLEMSRGRMFVEMTMEVPPAADGGPPTDVVVTRLAAAAAAQAPMLRDSPDLDPQATDHSAALHYLLIALVLGYLLWFQIIVALIAGATDRGLRDHLLAWFARDPHRAPVDVVDLPDVTEEVRRRHRRHRRAVVVRSLVVGGLIAVVYEAKLGFGIPGGIGVLAAVGLALSGADVVRERRRALRTKGAAPSAAFCFGMLAASLCSVILAAGGAMVVFMVAMSAIYDPPDMTIAQKKGALLAYVALGVSCFLLADVPMRLVRRAALARASREASSDPRPTILFLRSFADDGLRVRVRRGAGGSTIERWSLRRREGFEQLLALALGQLGPVVAVGEPGTKLPPLGATRKYYDNDQWRAGVDAMALDSQLIVFTVGRSEGVTEEVSRVRRAGLLGKCLFVLPPVPTREARARLRVLSWALGVDPGVLSAADETGARILAVSVGPDARLICWRVGGRTDIAYQVVLETASARAVLQTDTRLHGVAARFTSVDDSARRLLVTSANRVDARRIRWRKRSQRAWIPLYALMAVVTLLTTTAGPAENVPVPGVLRATASVFWLGQRPDGGWLGLSSDVHHLLAVSSSGSRTVLAFREQALVASISGDSVFLSTMTPNAVMAVRATGTTATKTWETPLPSRPGRTAVVGNRVVVLLPQIDRAAVLDLGTGHLLGTVPLPRGPRDVVAVGATAVIAGQTDSTLTTVDPARMRVVRTAPSPVVPFVLLGSGTDLFVGSIADNAVVRMDPSGHVTARADVPRFLGVLGVDQSTVTAGTYGDIPTVVALRRGDLGMMTTMPAPETVDVLAGAGSETRAGFSGKRAVVSLP